MLVNISTDKHLDENILISSIPEFCSVYGLEHDQLHTTKDKHYIVLALLSGKLVSVLNTRINSMEERINTLDIFLELDSSVDAIFDMGVDNEEYEEKIITICNILGERYNKVVNAIISSPTAEPSTPLEGEMGVIKW
jgi:hypothetical protein